MIDRKSRNLLRIEILSSDDFQIKPVSAGVGLRHRLRKASHDLDEKMTALDSLAVLRAFFERLPRTSAPLRGTRPSSRRNDPNVVSEFAHPRQTSYA
jgi:hypothetical protein